MGQQLTGKSERGKTWKAQHLKHCASNPLVIFMKSQSEDASLCYSLTRRHALKVFTSLTALYSELIHLHSLANAP
jgi:hypothetical protein